MLQSLDFSIISVIAEKRQGDKFGKQFLKSLSFIGIIEKISAIYQFKPLSMNLKIDGEMGMTHIAFCLSVQLKDSEDWGQDFGKQIQHFAKSSAEMTSTKFFEVHVLDFRSQFAMCRGITVPYPEWAERPECLYPSLEVLPEKYIHPVMNKSMTEILTPGKSWDNSAFLRTGRSLLSETHLKPVI